MKAFPRELRDLSHVPRWSIARKIRTQSVAEHSFYVAHYAYTIATIIEWEGNHGSLLSKVLFHDVPECITSDVPGPVKRELMDPDSLSRYEDSVVRERWRFYPTSCTPEEKAILKTADLLDETLYLAGEIQMGNSSVWDYFNRASERMYDSVHKLPVSEVRERELRAYLNTAIDGELRGRSQMVMAK